MPAMLLEDLIRKGGAPLKDAKQGSISWFFRTVRKLRKDNATQGESPTRTGYSTKGSGTLQGQMIAFSYDPKWKKKLPYYDRYPLVIPLSVDSKSMLGLNLHYLPPRIRLAFIRALQELATTQNGVRRMKVSYQIVKSAKALSAYAPCIKRYLNSHIQSKVVRVDDREWEHAALLPLARFVGATESEVWANSTSGMRAHQRKKAREVKQNRLKQAARAKTRKLKREQRRNPQA